MPLYIPSRHESRFCPNFLRRGVYWGRARVATADGVGSGDPTYGRQRR